MQGLVISVGSLAKFVGPYRTSRGLQRLRFVGGIATKSNNRGGWVNRRIRCPAKDDKHIPARMQPAAAAQGVSSLTLQENPLLKKFQLPLFDEIQAEHVVPGMTQLLEELNEELDKLETQVEASWSGLVEPLERIYDRLSRTWGAVKHLQHVKDSKELREAVEAVQPLQVKLSLRLAQSKPIYEAFHSMRSSDSIWSALTEAQKRIVSSSLKEAELGGVALEGESKERFNQIEEELSKLSTNFGNNLLDATKSFSKLLEEKSQVDGLPASALALAAQSAKAAGHEDATPENGPWLFTLDMPSLIPVLTHSKNRALREEMYRANITRASSEDGDNGPIIKKILILRKEKAKLLGYSSHAEVSLATKMASPEQAEKLLEDLRSASYERAEVEMKELEEFAAAEGSGLDSLAHWDVSYWAERMREKLYAISDEELRPYLSFPNVLEGLFSLAKRLFSVEIVPADDDPNMRKWNDDVRAFKVKSINTGADVAFFFLDPYSRPSEKRGGAWMDEVVGRSRVMASSKDGVRLPVAHMVCNQTPPVGDKPSLMTFREVETLFHESGHCLQHLLTQVDEGLAAGIRNIEWDAVELPSQFMENWCYDRQTLFSFAKHYETGEPIPEELYQRLKAAKTYRAASMMLRQLHFSMVDLELHSRYDPESTESVFEVDQRIAKKMLVMQPLKEGRFLCGFGHIFAGGYSAGYYSYKWAEVLSADAFSAFEEVGLENESAIQETGKRFASTVLAMGGGRDPAKVFEDFRGRQPSIEALLKHSGLIEEAVTA